MLLQCGAELNRQSMSGCSELPPHPQGARMKCGRLHRMHEQRFLRDVGCIDRSGLRSRLIRVGVSDRRTVRKFRNCVGFIVRRSFIRLRLSAAVCTPAVRNGTLLKCGGHIDRVQICEL